MTQEHSLRSNTSSERFYLLIDQGFVMDGHRDRCCSVVGFKKKIKSAPRTYIDRQIDGCKQVRERWRLRKEMRGGPNAVVPTTHPPAPPPFTLFRPPLHFTHRHRHNSAPSRRDIPPFNQKHLLIKCLIMHFWINRIFNLKFYQRTQFLISVFREINVFLLYPQQKPLRDKVL